MFSPPFFLLFLPEGAGARSTIRTTPVQRIVIEFSLSDCLVVRPFVKSAHDVCPFQRSNAMTHCVPTVVQAREVMHSEVCPSVKSELKKIGCILIFTRAAASASLTTPSRDWLEISFGNLRTILGFPERLRIHRDEFPFRMTRTRRSYCA